MQHQIRGGKTEQVQEKRANVELEKKHGELRTYVSLCKSGKYAENLGGARGGAEMQNREESR